MRVVRLMVFRAAGPIFTVPEGRAPGAQVAVNKPRTLSSGLRYNLQVEWPLRSSPAPSCVNSASTFLVSTRHCQAAFELQSSAEFAELF